MPLEAKDVQDMELILTENKRSHIEGSLRDHENDWQAIFHPQDPLQDTARIPLLTLNSLSNKNYIHLAYKIAALKMLLERKQVHFDTLANFLRDKYKFLDEIELCGVIREIDESLAD